MQLFYLIDQTNDSIDIIDEVMAESLSEADNMFRSTGWLIGETVAESPFLNEFDGRNGDFN
jgi:hypothetical protein